jgi:hypothetical protein
MKKTAKETLSSGLAWSRQQSKADSRQRRE